MNRDKLAQLTAWTNDFKVGGFAFYRDPPRDPSGSKFTVELEKCRPQVIRLVNKENQAPVRDLPFVLTVGTGPPNYQFLGETPGREMKTNDQGEAVYRWFPDWKTHGSYVEIADPHWVRTGEAETVKGAMLVKVRKSRFAARKRVVGQLASARHDLAGFYVEMYSFQGEEKNQSDVRYAFTDENGKFAADYLPGSTYCINLNDARYVSNIIDLIPYDPDTQKTNPPSLTLSEGQPVELALTSGPARAPIAYQSIFLQTLHDFSWHANGTKHNGRGSRRWSATTDEHGKARTFALAGEKIQASVFTPDWRSEASADVKTNGLTRLEIHRDVAAARLIRGRLHLAAGVAANLRQADIEIGSVDGETHERLTRKASDTGEFSFESKASKIGIYARTKDSRAAVVAVVDHFDRPLELKLKPTVEFRGRLLGNGNRPVKSHAVRAAVHVGKFDWSKNWPTSFQAADFPARTDERGNYSISGLPCECTIRLFADSLNGPSREQFLDDIYLVPGESRPRRVSRLSRRRGKPSFADALCRDAARLPFVAFRRAWFCSFGRPRKQRSSWETIF